MYASGLSPERWFARYAHTISSEDFLDLRYEDPAIDRWMQRLAQLIEQSAFYPSLDHFRRRHLTWHERRQVDREVARG